MDRLVTMLGKDGHRALALANADRRDDGYFGPGSVSWKVWGHPMIAVAGIRGSITAVLDPHGAAGVAQHSDYPSDPLGRVRRSNMFFLAAVFGDTATAEKLGTWLFNRHARVTGVVPTTGEHYVANIPETLLFVYVTGWHGVLRCYQKLALEPLDDNEIRQFYAESVVTAELLGIPARLVPRTPDEVEDYLRAADEKIVEVTPDAVALLNFFLRPPFKPRWPMTPINPFLRMATWTALSTMPDHHLEVLGVRRRPALFALNDAIVKGALNAARLPVVDDFLVLAGPEAWGRRHNATRRATGSGRIPYPGGRADALQAGPGGTLAGQLDELEAEHGLRR